MNDCLHIKSAFLQVEQVSLQPASIPTQIRRQGAEERGGVQTGHVCVAAYLQVELDPLQPAEVEEDVVLHRRWNQPSGAKTIEFRPATLHATRSNTPASRRARKAVEHASDQSTHSIGPAPRFRDASLSGVPTQANT